MILRRFMDTMSTLCRFLPSYVTVNKNLRNQRNLMSLNKIAKWLIGRFYFYILALLEKTFFVVYEDTLVTFGAKIQIFCILGTLSTYILENSHFLVYQIYFCFSNLVTLISSRPYVGRNLLKTGEFI